MHCLDDAETPHPSNQLSFMLHELVFFGCHLQFALYPYTFASYSDSCTILQPYIAATVRMRYDAIIFSNNASRMEKFIKNQ